MLVLSFAETVIAVIQQENNVLQTQIQTFISCMNKKYNFWSTGTTKHQLSNSPLYNTTKMRRITNKYRWQDNSASTVVLCCQWVREPAGWRPHYCWAAYISSGIVGLRAMVCPPDNNWNPSIFLVLFLSCCNTPILPIDRDLERQCVILDCI